MEFEINSWKTADMQVGETLQACYPDYTYWSYYYMQGRMMIRWWDWPVSESSSCKCVEQSLISKSMQTRRQAWQWSALGSEYASCLRFTGDMACCTRCMIPFQSWGGRLVFDAALIMLGVSNLVYSPLRCDIFPAFLISVPLGPWTGCWFSVGGIRTSINATSC